MASTWKERWWRIKGVLKSAAAICYLLFAVVAFLLIWNYLFGGSHNIVNAIGTRLFSIFR